MQVLLQQHKSWVAESTKFIAAYGESAPTDCDLEGATSSYESKNLRKAERALEEKLRALVADLEALLAPLLGPQSRVQSLVQTLTFGAEGSVPVLKEGSASLLMLIDPTLQNLPWEALQVTAAFNGRVSRDFSLHMTHHRLQTLTTPPAGATPPAPAAATAAAGTNAAPAITVSASSLRYIVDPLREDEYAGSRMVGLERSSITQAVQTLIQGPATSSERSSLTFPFASMRTHHLSFSQMWIPVSFFPRLQWSSPVLRSGCLCAVRTALPPCRISSSLLTPPLPPTLRAQEPSRHLLVPPPLPPPRPLQLRQPSQQVNIIFKIFAV